MKLHYKKIITLVISIVVALAGCADKRDKQDDPVLNAYRLIDEQRPNEAIELLEVEIAMEPDNIEYKVVLASAYAHKGGIKIQKLVPIVNHSDKLKSLNDKFPKVDGSKDLSQRVNAAAINMSILLTQFAEFFKAYASVPLVSTDQATYLRHAIYILNEIGDKIKPEDALYRAILGIVLFKHILAEDFIGEFVEPVQKNESTCRPDLGRVNDGLITIGKLLIDVFIDLGFANARQAKDMKQMAEETGDVVSDLTIFFTSVAVLDEVSNIFLRQAVIQNGFGKIIRCSGQ